MPNLNETMLWHLGPGDLTLVTEVTRTVKDSVARLLWGRAAGRCMFTGCNKPLWKSSTTQEQANIAQKAHIYSFSKNGPRGNAGIQKEDINKLSNLLLVCHECHVEIDKEKDGGRYSVEVLKGMKLTHEQRIELVTGIALDKSSHIVLYGIGVGDFNSPLTYDKTASSLFPERYPAEDHAINLGTIDSADKETDPQFWENEERSLTRKFNARVKTRLADGSMNHLSIFAIAPQPLLVRLGTLLTDIAEVDVYQRHREPQTWNWLDDFDDFDYIVNEPTAVSGKPVLLLSLSATVTHDRITALLGNDISIWKVTIANPNNDFLKSKNQLAKFRATIRPIVDKIKASHGQKTLLHVFPVAPLSIAVELGRIRQPKADMPWLIYDEVSQLGGFIPTIEIR